MKFEPYSQTTKFLSLCVLSNMLTAFSFLKCSLNGVLYLTDTDIFASFICEKIYKRRILSIKHITITAKCSSGKLLLLFYYINFLTYCVGYKHCYMFNAE